MEEQEWLKTNDPMEMIRLLPRPVSSRKCRLLACACVRQHLPSPDPFNSAFAITVAEKMADGHASQGDLDAAIAATENRNARNGWSYLVAATATSLHPIGIEAIGLTLDHLNTFNLELFDKVDYAGPVGLFREVFGNPFRPVTLDSRWLTSTAIDLANAIYQEKSFDRMPILADALMDAGCDSEEIINHCRGDAPHVRGCWVVDLLTERE